MEINKIHCGDCLELMKEIEDKSIDMILCDLPYGTTACSWDTIIPIDKLWNEYERIIKDKGAIVLTAMQPFTTILINSNMKLYKYSWIWIKSMAGNFINANNCPLKITEDICIFSKGTIANKSQRRMNYYPQGVIEVNKKWSRPSKYNTEHKYVRPSHSTNRIIKRENFPKNILTFANGNNKTKHPTQKPVALFEYLIKTYTNEGDLVLDNCIGSGTTAVACQNLNRDFIGIELSPEYCKIAEKRLNPEQTKITALTDGGKDE